MNIKCNYCDIKLTKSIQHAISNAMKMIADDMASIMIDMEMDNVENKQKLMECMISNSKISTNLDKILFNHYKMLVSDISKSFNIAYKLS